MLLLIVNKDKYMHEMFLNQFESQKVYKCVSETKLIKN